MGYYGKYSKYQNYTPSPRVNVPGLGARLDKLAKEPLNASTQNFLKSLMDFFKKGGYLTQNQYDSFEKIESRFSPAEKKKLQGWATEYNADYLADAKILAAYYAQTGYWTDLAKSILEESNYVPEKAKFLKLRNNKYAEKVLLATKTPAKFAVSDMIQIRSTAGTPCEQDLIKLRHRLCFVLNNALPITSAVVGAKRYKVLPLGHSDPIIVEERHIMKPNKKGKAA